MTTTFTDARDNAGPIPGYYDSPWPAECGGPRRQKMPRSAGINVSGQSVLQQHTRTNGEWNVMTLLRDPGEVYLMGNNRIDSAEKYGFLERIDPVSLETIYRSPNLDAGGHTWCGGVVAHENGYLYLSNGNRCFKLDPDCQVIAERVLPQDSAYNGCLIAPDGNLVMKNLEYNPAGSSRIVVLDPEKLEPVAEETPIPENSMGRIALDASTQGTFIYVPGNHAIYRYNYDRGRLKLDESWQPIYRPHGNVDQGYCWDSCIAGGGCYFLDNGDNQANETIFSTRPFGQKVPPRGSAFKGLASSPQKLFRVDLDDASRIEVTAPFGTPNGSILSPPAYDPERNIALAFDTGNGLLGALHYNRESGFKMLWSKNLRISMQMVLFSDTGEIVVNDFQDGYDNLVVIDIETGQERGRTITDSKTANGMFLGTGWERDVYYCSISSIARMSVA